MIPIFFKVYTKIYIDCTVRKCFRKTISTTIDMLRWKDHGSSWVFERMLLKQWPFYGFRSAASAVLHIYWPQPFPISLAFLRINCLEVAALTRLKWEGSEHFTVRWVSGVNFFCKENRIKIIKGSTYLPTYLCDFRASSFQQDHKEIVAPQGQFGEKCH